MCNIGPEEIEARRRSGHFGVLASVALFAVLVVDRCSVDGPLAAGHPRRRRDIRLPAGVSRASVPASALSVSSISGARQGQDGSSTATRCGVTGSRRVQIGLAGFAIGVVVAAVAVALPVCYAQATVSARSGASRNGGR